MTPGEIAAERERFEAWANSLNLGRVPSVTARHPYSGVGRYINEATNFADDGWMARARIARAEQAELRAENERLRAENTELREKLTVDDLDQLENYQSVPFEVAEIKRALGMKGGAS